MFTLQDGREHLYQWDLNRYVVVNDSAICEVHFCNRTADCSLVVEVKDGLAAIPNILLQDARPIRVYAYCDDSYTLTEQQFTVKSRTKPADYVYTETEVITWKGIVERVNETTEQAEATVNAAVERTEEAITNANNATVNANNAADNANSAADDALEATTNAINAAEAAKEVIGGLEASTIICSATGTDIVLTDSSNQPLQGLKVFGKSTQFTTTGANIFGGDALADKLVELSKATKDEEAETVYVLAYQTSGDVYFNDFKPDTRYTFIFKVSVSPSGIPPFAVRYTDGTTARLTSTAVSDKTIIYTSTAGKTVEAFQGANLAHATLYYNECGIFEGVLTADDFEPYTGGMPVPNPECPQAINSVGDKGEVNVKITGKNLFGGDALADKLVKVSTAKKDEEAGTVYFTGGNASGKTIFDTFKENTQYTFIFKCSVTQAGPISLVVRYEDGSTVGKMQPKTGEVTTCVLVTPAGKTIKSFYGSWYSDSTLYYNECGIFEGVLTADDFEPYKPEQTITIPTTDGLPGVPTINGGWVCDEIDFERGVYIQRVEKIAMPQSWAYTTSYNYPIFYAALSSGVYTDAGLSDIFARDLKYNVASTYGTYAEDNTFALRSDGQQIFARVDAYKTEAEFKEAVKNGSLWVGLITPIETPLTEEELNTYRTLHTNKPNTIVSNDEEAEMQVDYAADTKTYIDNKFAELATALLNK